MSLPDVQGVTHVRWWGQNTLLTFCTTPSISIGNTTVTPTLDFTFVVYNPDNLLQVLPAITIPSEDPGIVCGLIGKQKLSDPAPLNPYEINKNGIFGIGYSQNGKIIPITLADADWVGGGKPPMITPAAKGNRGPSPTEDCTSCHP